MDGWFLLASMAVFAAWFGANIRLDRARERESRLPAIRGIHGEILMRGGRARLLTAWSELLLIPVFALKDVREFLGAHPLPSIVFLATGVVVTLGWSIPHRHRERFVITDEGITRVYGWWAKRLHFSWEEISAVWADKHGGFVARDVLQDIRLIGPDRKKMRIPLGMIGYPDLLEAIEARVPQSKWNAEFTSLMNRVSQRRDASEIAAGGFQSLPPTRSR